MGTANFYVKNASKYFVVLENYEDNMVQCQPDEWDVDNLKSDLHERFEKLPFGFQKDDRSDHDRNFGGTYLGAMRIDKMFGDIDVDVVINIILRSGYYEAAVLDWEIKLYVDGDEVDDDYLWSDRIIEYSTSDMSKGLQTIQFGHIRKWYPKAMDKLIYETEKVFENVCSTKLICVGRASNGEAFYKKVD
jgi:hypothetical protein